MQFLIGEALEIDQMIARSTGGANQFVQFQMDRFRVAVLRVLNQEYHQESDDGGAGVNDQLPGIRVMKKVAGGGPDHDNRDGDDESPRGPEDSGSAPGENAKSILHPADEIALLRLRLRPAVLARFLDAE